MPTRTTAQRSPPGPARGNHKVCVCRAPGKGDPVASLQFCRDDAYFFSLACVPDLSPTAQRHGVDPVSDPTIFPHQNSSFFFLPSCKKSQLLCGITRHWHVFFVIIPLVSSHREETTFHRARAATLMTTISLGRSFRLSHRRQNVVVDSPLVWVHRPSPGFAVCRPCTFGWMLGAEDLRPCPPLCRAPRHPHTLPNREARVYYFCTQTEHRGGQLV